MSFRKLFSRKSFNKIVFAFLFVLVSNIAKAQVPLDSLLQKITYQKEDTTKAKLYYDIAKSYFVRDRSMFKVYTDSLLRLSKKLKYNNGIGLAYSAYGFYYSYTNEWEKVKWNLQKSDSVYEKMGKTASVMNNKSLFSMYYKYVGEYNKALQNDIVLLNYYEKNGPKTSEAKMLGSIALLLTQLERYKESEEYFYKSINLRHELKDYSGEAHARLNFGAMLAERGYFKKAEPFIKESLRLQKISGNTSNENVCKANLVHIYAETGKAKKALELAIECEVVLARNFDTTNLVKMGIYRSIAYTKLKQFDNALKALNLKHHLIKNQRHYRELEADFLWQYYKVYKAMGKTDVALEFLEKAKDMEDISRNMHIQHGVSRTKEFYETRKKQKENRALRKANELKDLQISQRNYLVFGSILLLILTGIIAFTTIRYNRLKNEKIAVEMEQRLLQTQMNPHFIFNVLHAIHTYMLRKDTDESGKLLTSFARLIRSILQHSSTDNIPLSEELNWLKDYIRLQQLRFTDSFEYTVEIDDAISPDNVLLPPMLIQPFIENSVEHGFSGIERKGELKISYKKIGNELEIRITDNGKGFSSESLSGLGKDHESLAVQITEKRVVLLNKRRKGAFKFKIESIPAEGTSVYFSVPYKTLFD